MDNRGRLLIFAIALASTAAPFTKLGFEEFGLSTVVFVRFVLASLILLPKKGIDFGVWRKNSATYFAGAASIVLSALALEGMPVAVVVVMFALTPALTMLHRTATQRKPLSSHDAGAIAVALVGVLILSNFSSQDLQVPVLGMVSLVMALILFTAYFLSQYLNCGACSPGCDS
jgi:drug/metabolite transporter (DMT)-like permease